MTLGWLIVLTLILGVLIYGLGRFPAIDADFKQVIKVVALIAIVILWILFFASLFGVHGGPVRFR